ncbi:hypothetical protein HF865_03540 [Lactobacillus reuteri]|uniref:Uncharacterized protein n=1 Tax=Limosilactobacillus reuteri TaxID=1598 RepID=A0AAW9ZG23_LIMRT|nr:hypothetical protein [Limosilactobacillus reuteri]NME21784.1 hypothetical protein [Limosilactobacillus reuteri]
MEKYNEGNNLIDLMSVAAFGPATEAKVAKIDNTTNTDYLYVNERAVQKRMAEDQEDNY